MARNQTKTAVVTGGASGIGRAIALAFADEGTDVVVADIQPNPREGGDPTHEHIRSNTDARAMFVECDVTEPDQVANAVAAADEFGGVDVLVNNAGIYRREPLLETSVESFKQTLDINVTGVFLGSKHAAERMMAGSGGSIINISSIAGISGVAGESAYCASKGAVRLLTYALADELGPEGIRVNAVHPGTTETTMTTNDVVHIDEDDPDGAEDIPLRRYGDPEDIADTVRFLASEDASYITGESIVVDGGVNSTL